MLSKIKVYGRLAKFLGQRSFYAEVKSPIEAFKFLVTNFPKLQAHAMQQKLLYKKLGHMILQIMILIYLLVVKR